MISIAMTTYNGEKYIEKQLLSILNQTVKPDEVIIVDDCSKDNTVELISKFIENNKLNNWSIFKLPKNGGFINSFNEAISKTSGEIIFLCDQDDIWMPDKIEIMSKYMINNPDILCLTSSFEKINKNDEKIECKRNIFSSNNNLIRKKIKENECIPINIFEVITYNISPGCTYAFRDSIREKFKKTIDEQNCLVHDWKINIIAALEDGLYFLNKVTIKYRIHENNTLGLQRNIDIILRSESCINSRVERGYMYDLILKLDRIKSNNNDLIYMKALEYVKRIDKSLLERINALKEKNLFRSVYTIFKFNLFKNRMYESVVIDSISILKYYFSKIK